MAATTKTYRDGNGATFTAREWDDGTAHSAVQILGDGAGGSLASASGILTRNTALTDFGAGEYEYVAASATDQILGATGAVGDYLSHLLVVPETTTPGAVSLTDGNGTARVIFVGGASSVSNLVPFTVAIGAKAVNATTPGWKITTTTNIHVLGFGNFT